MSYNGSGTFQINTSGQPVVTGTTISSTAFNSLTSDLATGLSTAITKDGQTTTTVQIPFAQGLRSTLVTDSSSITTGSAIVDGGMGVAKNLYVGGILSVTGATTLTNPVINNIKMGYSTTATAAGTTTLTISSNYRQFFTGILAQTIVLPVTSTLVTGIAYEIENNSTGLLTVNSSGGNLVGTIPAGVCAHAVCIGTTLTTAADWDWDYISTSTITGTGANVLGTSPTLATPILGTPQSATLTNATGLPLTTGVTGTLPVANGGTGAATLTGYGAVVMNSAGTAATSVAPSTSGNLLTSNGTSWTSAAPSGGVTSAVAGNGVSVSAATGAVTFAVAAPTFNTVGSYVQSYMNTTTSTGITAGANYSAGTGFSQVQGSIWTQNSCTGVWAPVNSNVCSGTWKHMGGTFAGNSVNSQYMSVFVRVS